jgi:hypothetical protein
MLPFGDTVSPGHPVLIAFGPAATVAFCAAGGQRRGTDRGTGASEWTDAAPMRSPFDGRRRDT